MSRQVVIAFALVAAAGVLIAVMMWSTAARGHVPDRPADVARVERAVRG